MTLERLEALGFDLSKHIPFTKSYKIGCSCCNALSINGTPCHESGCPNTKWECRGCDAIVPRSVKYCEDCN